MNTPSAPDKGKRNLVVGIAAGVLGGIVAASAAALGAYVGFVKRTNKDFYAKAERLFKIPEIHAGFDAQDLFFAPEERIWLVSGYMACKGPSPILKVHEDGSYERVAVELPDGNIYRGHGAAVCVHGSYGYLTVKDGYVVLHRDELMKAPHGSTVKAIAHITVPLEPAFMTIHDDTFYIGEFYHRLAYPTPADHWKDTSGGTKNPALVYAYQLNDDSPYGIDARGSAAYSIPGDIQGMAFTDDGRIVLSQSWGLGNSTLLVYSAPAVEAAERGTYSIDGCDVPLRFLESNNLVQTLRVPPMSEGIEAIGNRLYMINESASNLYVLGKFYQGMYALSFEV